MSSTKLRIVSALATLSLLAGTAGVASFAQIASAATNTTTNAATNVTSSGATLNGTNGDTAAIGSSFWVSTSTFSTASPTVPTGVFSTPDLGPVGSSTAFSSAASAATGLGTIQPNTTYYYAAWTNVNGTWMPGSVQHFTTLASTSPTISNVQVQSTQTCNASATITWNTNVPTRGFVSYGPTMSYGSTTTLETTASTNHSVTINNLNCSASYHFAITATDNSNNTSTSSDMTFTSGTTTNVNSISSVHITNVGTSSAMVSWNTSNPSTGTVWYGTTNSYGSSANSSTTASTTQSVTISGLNPGTLYHIAVSATGAATTTDMTFTTQSTGTSTPLAVTGIDAVKTTAIADNTFANGWEWVMHLTVPNNENAFRIKFSDWMNGSTSFPANGNMEIWSAQSSNASTSGSMVTAIGNNYDLNNGWLYLNGDADNNSANGRQIDVHILVKIPFNTAAGNYTTTFTAQSWPQNATSTASTT
jgi:hypothetical protein